MLNPRVHATCAVRNIYVMIVDASYILANCPKIGFLPDWEGTNLLFRFLFT